MMIHWLQKQITSAGQPRVSTTKSRITITFDEEDLREMWHITTSIVKLIRTKHIHKKSICIKPVNEIATDFLRYLRNDAQSLYPENKLVIKHGFEIMESLVSSRHVIGPYDDRPITKVA